MQQKPIQVQQAIASYLTYKSQEITSAHTRYKAVLKKFARYIGEENILQELSTDYVIGFHEEMKNEGYSLATIAFSTRVIRNFLGFWQGRQQVNLNLKEIKPPKYLTPEQAVVSEEDFDLMSEHLDERYTDELQKKLAIHLLWDTGMRVSELTGLTLENLNPPNREGVRTATIRTRKTNQYNLVVWSKETDELLTKYLGWRLAHFHPTDYVFVRTDRRSEKNISTRTIERWVKQLVKLHGLNEQITPHSFRHGKAHYILDNGGTAIDVQTVLRHKNFNSSLHYMRLNQTKYVQRASRFLSGSSADHLPKENELQIPNYQRELVYNQAMVYTRK